MRRDWAAHCRTHGLDSTCHRPWQWQRRRLLYLRAAGPTAAATSADTDETKMIVSASVGLSPCALLLEAHSIGAPAACRCPPIACTACTTCREELMT